MKKFLIKTLIICSLIPIVNVGVTVKAEELKIAPNSVVTMSSEEWANEVNPEKNDWKTPFKKIGNTNYEASIAGKGEYADEEGIGTVLIRNLKDNSYKAFKFIDKDNLEHPQVSALKVVEGKDDTLYIIVGQAWGHAPHGHALYSLNLKDGTSKVIESVIDSAVIRDAKFINPSILKTEIWLFDTTGNHTVDYGYVLAE